MSILPLALLELITHEYKLLHVPMQDFDSPTALDFTSMFLLEHVDSLQTSPVEYEIVDSETLP